MRAFALMATACAAALFAGVVMAEEQRSAGARSTDLRATSAPQFRLVGTIKDLMNGIVDPAADRVWQAVWTEDSARGLIEHQPKTDEEWAAVEHGALVLAEAANLLKMPGRAVARPEELHGKSTLDPAELTPAQIGERIARSRQPFLKFADMLQDAAGRAVVFARVKDTKGIFEAGRQIYAACVACHEVYWYPGSGPPRATTPTTRQ